MAAASLSTRPVTGLLGGARATFEEYSRLFTTEFRPAKFSWKEAGLQTAERNMPTCADCTHWYQNPLTRRSVCEVVRRPDEQNILARMTCRFQNRDGQHYPLLEVL